MAQILIHGRFKRHLRFSLSSIKEDCPAVLSESLTTEAVFFPTKAEGTYLHESLENVSVMTLTFHGVSTTNRYWCEIFLSIFIRPKNKFRQGTI